MSGATSSNIKVIVGFDDRALAGIPGAAKKIDSLETSANRASKGLLSLNSSGSAAKLAKGMRGVAQESLRAFENMGRIMGPLEVITGAASIAGLAHLTSEWAGLTTQLGYSAQRAGIGVNQLNQLQGAATLAGVSAQALTGGMTALNDNLTNAAAGRAPEAVAAFNYLHVALRDTNGQLRSSSQVLPELADHLAAIKNPAIQAQLAATLFGGSAEQMLPFLRQGAAGIAELSQEAASYGTKSAKDIAIAQKFTHQQGELTLALAGVANVLGEDFVPALGNAEAGLAHFIRQNKDAVADGVAGMTVALGGFSAWVSGKFMAILAKKLGIELPALFTALPGFATDALKLLDAPAAAAAIALTPNTSIQSGAEEEAALRDAIEKMNVQRKAEGLPPLPLPMAQPSSLSETVYQQNSGSGKATAGLAEPLADKSLPSTAQNFLNALAGPESGGSYGKLYGGGNFSGYDQFPNWNGLPGPAGTSHAAGRYQFEPGTYQQAAQALGLTDFSPQSQDKAAWYLAQQNYRAQTGRDLLTDLNMHDPKVDAGIKAALASTWPSIGSDNFEAPTPKPHTLPALSLPSPHDASTGHRNPNADVAPASAGIQPVPERDDKPPPGEYRSALTGKDETLGSAASGPDASVSTAPSAPAANVADGTGAASAAKSETTVKGSATVTVKLQGAPPGTRTSAISDGDLFASAGPIRVESSAVGTGMPS